jgi:uncharacterized protein YegP (UPF0339 family)
MVGDYRCTMVAANHTVLNQGMVGDYHCTIVAANHTFDLAWLVTSTVP